MSQPFIKSRLLLGNKHLGDIFYNKDKEGRGYLKLSLKNKVADLVIGSTVPTPLPAALKLSYPVKLELSYKFQGDVFSVKCTPDGGKPSYQFHKISIPPSTCLFYLRIKDVRLLDDDAGTSPSPLILDMPKDVYSVAIIFSFFGVDGHPLSPPEYSNMLMGIIDLPEKPLSRFCIGVAPDADNVEPNNIVVMFPFPMSDAQEADF